MTTRRPNPTRLSGTPVRGRGVRMVNGQPVTVAVGKGGGGGGAGFLAVVNKLFRHVGAEINAPKDRADWNRNTYEKERKALKRKLTGIARSMAKLKLKLTKAQEAVGAAKADAAKVKEDATAEVRVLRGEKQSMAAQLQTLQMQLQLATQGGGRAAAPATKAPPRVTARLPKRPTAEQRRRQLEMRIRTAPEPEDAEDVPEDAEDFGYQQPIRSALSARVVIESHLGGRAVVVPLDNTGVYLITEADVETLRTAGPEKVGRAMQIAANFALSGDGSAADWRENL